MSAATIEGGERLAVPFMDAMRERLADYACHKCCECAFTRAIYELLDKSEAMPIADGCYNEHQLACVRELLVPSVADAQDGISATVFIVDSNQPACWGFLQRVPFGARKGTVNT